MEPLPGDTAVDRFLTFWKAIGVFFLFGVLTALVLLATRGCGAGSSFLSAEAERRLQARQEVDAAQALLAGPDSWAVDEAKGTARVPVDVAMRALLPALQERKQSATDRPVPGTAPFNEMMERQAAEAAAQAAPPAQEASTPPEPEGDGKPVEP